MRQFLILLLLAISHEASSEVTLKSVQQVSMLNFKLGIGSGVELQSDEHNRPMSGRFLGRMIHHPVYRPEILFLNEATSKVLMVDADRVVSTVSQSAMQPLISTVEQAGETCAAYAVYHYLQQLNEHYEIEKLKESFSIEHGRMKILEEAITAYYMGRSPDLNLVLRKFGTRFGMKCSQKEFKDWKSVTEFIEGETSIGVPVLMEFNIGPNMVESEYTFVDFETEVKLPVELWGPRKIGERNSGGHAIVAAGSFTSKGRKKLVVLDSNWNEPRIWDAEDYLGGKTALSEMIFHSCH